MNDWSNLETGLLIPMVGRNQTAFSTLNLKSVKLGWVTVDMSFLLPEYGASRCHLQSAVACYFAPACLF